MVDCFYDSDPETCFKFRTHSDQLRTCTDQKHRPGTIDTNASYGSTGHGGVPLPSKASNRNDAPSFDSKSASSRSQESKSFESDVKEDVQNSSRSQETESFESDEEEDDQNFDLWDDQQVKSFIQVSPIHVLVPNSSFW